MLKQGLSFVVTLSAYADYLERALYNHILASIAPDSGHVTYMTPLRPGDFRTYLDGPYCCQGTGIENAERFGSICSSRRRSTGASRASGSGWRRATPRPG